MKKHLIWLLALCVIAQWYVKSTLTPQVKPLMKEQQTQSLKKSKLG